MKVGVVGLGKLGLPIAVALRKYGGHSVRGWDTSEQARRVVSGAVAYEGGEPEVGEQLARERLLCFAPGDLAKWADVCLVVVPTPHPDHLDGTLPMADDGERADFDYAALVQACRSVRTAKAVVVVSTVLPGTWDRELRSIFPVGTTALYSPCFAAMGSVCRDVTHPEFILCGTDGNGSILLQELWSFSAGTPMGRVLKCSIATAELAKVAYNTFVGMKIAYANWVAQLADATGADGGDVMSLLTQAHNRIISTRYLEPGMGDGGACHPRDNLALSWLSQRHDVYDLPGRIMAAREAHLGWLASIAIDQSNLHSLPIAVVGRAYKPGTTLEAGSPALLLGELLATEPWDHVPVHEAHVYVLALDEAALRVSVPEGSVVVDPFGNYPTDAPGVTVIRPGRK